MPSTAAIPTGIDFTNSAAQRALAQRPRKPDLAQVVALQQALYNTALILTDDILTVNDKETRARIASSIASLAKGWQGLQDSKRIIRGKPLPGSKRPAVEQPKPKASRTLLPPTEEP